VRGQLADDRRAFSLSADDIAQISPNTRTCPVFRSSVDAELTKRIYARVPVLIDESKGKDGKPPGRAMPRHHARANAAQSAVRAHVEHPFAYQKGVVGLVIRTIGLARASATVTLANMAYNMRRWCWLDRRTAPG
jgi:hypothetical protein